MYAKMIKNVITKIFCDLKDPNTNYQISNSKLTLDHSERQVYVSQIRFATEHLGIRENTKLKLFWVLVIWDLVLLTWITFLNLSENSLISSIHLIDKGNDI